MEIEQLRQEINELLDNVIKHSNNYTGKEHLSALDVDFVLKKVNKVQESLTILKYLLDIKHQERGEFKTSTSTSKTEAKEDALETPPTIQEETKKEMSISGDIGGNVNGEVVTKKGNLEQPPIAKLADALALNDRYLYANELFDKDMNAFNELVKAIDNCSSLDEAVSLYISKDWELDNEHFISFTNLVERRFS